MTEHRPSNQVAEIIAAIEACETAVREKMSCIALKTDSKYVYNSLNKWIDLWEQNGWKANNNKPVINESLLKQLGFLKKQLVIKCS